MAPIRASKLRYFENWNFMERLLPAPLLPDGTYGDRPSRPSNHWKTSRERQTGGWSRGRGEPGTEGRTQGRSPALAQKRRRVPTADLQMDFLGEEERDGAPVVLEKSRGPGAFVGAQAMNEGSGRDAPILSI